MLGSSDFQRTRMTADDDQTIYAFFSQELHDRREGKETLQFRDVATGAVIDANWVGPETDGYPGLLENGVLARPAQYETFVRVGEVAPTKLVLINRPSDTMPEISFRRPKLTPS